MASYPPLDPSGRQDLGFTEVILRSGSVRSVVSIRQVASGAGKHEGF
jgi:hypothetical protein